MLRVIYEDNHLLVCEKPINMLVQADASGDEDLLTAAKSYIKQKYDKPGEVYLGLVHRLDRPVGGVMVFARTSKAAARLTSSFKTHTTVKRYAAVVVGTPPDNRKLENELLRDERTNTTTIVPQGTPGAKKASLDYVRLTSKKGLSLLDIQLHTGRHHQIRAQLSGSGYPIYGDQRYNAAAEAGQQIALWAYSLSFEHPTLKTRMTFISIPAEVGAWAEFADELKALAAGIRCSYVDKNIICVNKKAGIACAAADAPKDEISLETELESVFGGEAVFPVHRLDVPTKGLVLFARSREYKSILSKMIRERRIKKSYHARIFGKLKPDAGRFRLYGVKDGEGALMRVYDKPAADSIEMITDYKTLHTDGETSLVELTLVTGRMHQLRASLAHMGTPIVGDDKYGDRVRNRGEKGGLQLAAVRIEFPSGADVPKELTGLVIEHEADFA